MHQTWILEVFHTVIFDTEVFAYPTGIDGFRKSPQLLYIGTFSVLKNVSAFSCQKMMHETCLLMTLPWKTDSAQTGKAQWKSIYFAYRNCRCNLWHLLVGQKACHVGSLGELLAVIYSPEL